MKISLLKLQVRYSEKTTEKMYTHVTCSNDHKKVRTQKSKNHTADNTTGRVIFILLQEYEDSSRHFLVLESGSGISTKVSVIFDDVAVFKTSFLPVIETLKADVI